MNLYSLRRLSAILTLGMGAAAPFATQAQAPYTGFQPPGLLFWTHYEGTTALAPPADCYEKGCWQPITGSDPTTGFSWPPAINGGTAEFQLLVDPPGSLDPAGLNDYMYNEVQSVVGHNGVPTQAMFSRILQSGCCGRDSSQDAQSGSTQEPYMIFPGSDVGERYLSEWVMLQPDLVPVMSAGTWRDLFEWKTTDIDYRIQLSILNYNGSPPHWVMSGDSHVPSYQEFWRIENTTVPVPVGEWFKLEVYWKRSTGSDGRVWMAVNGQVIGDQPGPNVGPNNSPINRIMASQLYSGSVYPIFQWVDDLQIWSGFPSAQPGDAWFDPPYAPH